MDVMNKIKWMAGVSLIFFIVMVTNIIDRNHFNRLSNSVTTIYEDRIVASDLILEMSRIIHKKHIAVVSNNTSPPENAEAPSYQALNLLVERYDQTKLSHDEQSIFTELQEELKTLERKEKAMEDSSYGELLQSIKKIDQHLEALSKIQLQEGRKQVFISDRAIASVNLFTQIEIIFLVIMAVLVQVIILYKPKEVREK